MQKTVRRYTDVHRIAQIRRALRAEVRLMQRHNVGAHAGQPAPKCDLCQGRETSLKKRIDDFKTLVMLMRAAKLEAAAAAA